MKKEEYEFPIFVRFWLRSLPILIIILLIIIVFPYDFSPREEKVILTMLFIILSYITFPFMANFSQLFAIVPVIHLKKYTRILFGKFILDGKTIFYKNKLIIMKIKWEEITSVKIIRVGRSRHNLSEMKVEAKQGKFEFIFNDLYFSRMKQLAEIICERAINAKIEGRELLFKTYSFYPLDQSFTGVSKKQRIITKYDKIIVEFYRGLRKLEKKYTIKWDDIKRVVIKPIEFKNKKGYEVKLITNTTEVKYTYEKGAWERKDIFSKKMPEDELTKEICRKAINAKIEGKEFLTKKSF
jgi:hypothetical protein